MSLFNPLVLAAIGTETVKQLFQLPKSWRKEAIGIGTFVPAFISVFDTYQECQCWTNVTGEQWAFLAGSAIALAVHLNAKRVEAK